MLAAGLLLSVAARGVSAQSALAAAVTRGDTAWATGRFPDAKAAYRDAVAIDSMASSRAIYRLAVLHSWDGDLDRALDLFRRYVRLEPGDGEGRIALARTHAWNGQTDSAVAGYDAVLAGDSTWRDAALGAALALAWGGRFQQAVSRYDRWLTSHPRDVEAELGRARTLAWSGRLAEAEAAFAAIADRGERLEAEKGIALVAAWRGDLPRSEALWRRLVDRTPKDAESWVGLAQVLRWSGRSADARQALDRALAADPGSSDAAEQRRWVEADLAPAAEPGLGYAWDSDDNRAVVASGAIGIQAAPRARLTIGGYRREADLGAASGTGTAGRVALRMSLGRRVTLHGDAGVARMTGDDGAARVADRTVATGGLAMTIQATPRLTFATHARRQVFDETAAMLLSGIDVRAAGGEISWEPLGRVVLAAGAEWAALRGGSGPNERQSQFAAIRWRARRQLTLSMAGRRFAYDERRQDGYFAPAEFLLGEAGVRGTLGRELGWTAFAEAAAGAQRVTFTGPGDVRATQRAAAGIGFRPGPGSELAAEYGYSNVSGAAAEGNIYRAHSVALRLRLLF